MKISALSKIVVERNLEIEVERLADKAAKAWADGGVVVLAKSKFAGILRRSC